VDYSYYICCLKLSNAFTTRQSCHPQSFPRFCVKFFKTKSLNPDRNKIWIFSVEKWSSRFRETATPTSGARASTKPKMTSRRSPTRSSTSKPTTTTTPLTTLAARCASSSGTRPSRRFSTPETSATTTTACHCSTFSETWRLSTCPSETSLRPTGRRFIRRRRRTRCRRCPPSHRWPFKLVCLLCFKCWKIWFLKVEFLVNFSTKLVLNSWIDSTRSSFL